jgi:PhnB protein
MSDTKTAEIVAAQAPARTPVVPYLQLEGAVKAARFYERAFGATIAAMHPTDDKGRTMHVHLYLNGGSLMLSDFYPEHGHKPQQPAGFTVALIVDNADAWYERAIKAGATLGMPVQEMFWGDRYGSVRDPFGVEWAFNQAKKV